VEAVADARQTTHLTLGEWAVLGLLSTGSLHAFALVKATARHSELGQVWSVPTPVVYRAVDALRRKGLVEARGEERSDAGPRRRLVGITPQGQALLDGWLAQPVVHMRDVRTELLLKLALSARLHRDPTPLVWAQREAFAPLLGALERRAGEAQPGFDRIVAHWRLESAAGVMRFLDHLAEQGPS
jgi:PadR family transcriptional regulator AphA